MLHILCQKEIPEEPRGPGRGFAWTGGRCWHGSGFYCVEKTHHGNSSRETHATSAGACCLRPPKDSAPPITICRGIPRKNNLLVSPFGVQPPPVKKTVILKQDRHSWWAAEMKQDYWFDRFQSIYVISDQQGCRCWVAFTAVPHVARAAWLRSPYLCDWDWCVRAVHASYSAECFIRAVLGMAWHQCLGPALSSCGVLGTKCCILEEKKCQWFRLRIESRLTFDSCTSYFGSREHQFRSVQPSCWVWMLPQ